MKNLFTLLGISSMIVLSSCVNQKLGTSTYIDDVYADPAVTRAEENRIKEEKRLAKAAADKRRNDSLAEIARIQKEKDDANPAYKYKDYNADDYYDYEYATRIKRFNRNINGLSYYNNYYTNSYWYTGNPYNYGVSVYNGYSWWGPSYNYYSYNPSVTFYNSWGWGYGNQFGYYSGYNPYMAGYAAGYNNGFNNGLYGNYYGYGNPYYNPYGYYSYPYYGYGYGYPYYGYGYYSPYYNGWGYYNYYDKNSSYTYGPRSSHGGGNGRRESNPGIENMPARKESVVDQYIHSMASAQEVRPDFGDVDNQPVRGLNGTGGVKPVSQGNVSTPVKSSFPDNTTPTRNNYPVKNNPVKATDVNTGVSTIPDAGNNQPNTNYPVRNNPVKEAPVKQSEVPSRNDMPVKQTPVKSYEQPVKQQIETPRYEAPVRQTPSAPINGGGGWNSGGSGGVKSGSSGGSGGGHRPR